MDKSYYNLSIEEVYDDLKTSKQGLSDHEVKNRQKQYGKNVLEEKKESKWKIFFRQFNNLLVYVLLVASIISISIQEYVDFSVIALVIVVNGLIAFWQEIKAQTSISALKKLTESKNKVIRDGRTITVLSSELVPGDYIVLYEGEVVTADIRLVDERGLMVDESSITGESTPVNKDHTIKIDENSMPHDWKNMLLSGTIVVRGSCHGIVVKTAKNTYFASIAEKIVEASPDTPLTKALKFFTKRYVIFLILLFLSFGIVGYFQGRSVLELTYTLLAAIVSVVPEGLPIVITIVMVIGAVALSKNKALIRYLPSVETLGSATVIASDKTGTITKGKLIVKEVYEKDNNSLKTIAALCNDSHEKKGDPLDVALAEWVENFEEIKNNFPRKWTYSFDSKLMLMATVNSVNEKDKLFVKGAYEALKKIAIDDNDEINKKYNDFLNEGLRVLAFAEGEWENNKNPSEWKISIKGLIGFLDPPKNEIKEAVDFAKKANVKVIMITGDHPKTAKAIAKEVNIYNENDNELTGKDIDELSEDKLQKALLNTTVLARILPEHKYKVVKLLQKTKNVVAVTGDGVNDVPALKAADIGIAMGSGTEAAKDASDMVITDSNLKVIIHAITNARVIADNIRKVIYYLVSTSFQEICLISLSIFLFLPLPMRAIQILWINLVTDGVMDKTFAFAKEEGDVTTRKPKKPEKQFFDLVQIIRIFCFGFPVGLVCLFIYMHLLKIYTYDIVSSVIFNGVVMAQWANGIQSQKQKEPFFKNIKRSFTINPYIYLGLLVGIVLQSAILYFIPSFFHVASLNMTHWNYIFLMFISSFFIVEIRKWIEVFIDYIRKK